MILLNDPVAIGLIASAAGVTFNPETDQCLARVQGFEVLGGVIFKEFTGASIQIHVAGFAPDWINKEMLWVTFDYPFNQLGVKKLFGPVPATNSKALEFDSKLGFKEVARIADVYPDGDLVLMAMSRDECRFLKMRCPEGFLLR